jgi:hypothetical protein
MVASSRLAIALKLQLVMLLGPGGIKQTQKPNVEANSDRDTKAMILKQWQ